MCLAHRHGLFAPGESLAENDTLAVPCSLPYPPKPLAKTADAGHPNLRMVFELWFEEGACTTWFAKPAEAVADFRGKAFRCCGR